MPFAPSLSGMHPSETAIMDRWDQGLGVAAIAAQTGQTEARVRKIVSRYDADDDWQSRARAGSAKMAAAVLAIGSYA